MRLLAIRCLFPLNMIRAFFDQITKLIRVITLTNCKYTQISRKSPQKISFIFVWIAGKLLLQMSRNIFIEKALNTTARIKRIQIQNKAAFK